MSVHSKKMRLLVFSQYVWQAAMSSASGQRRPAGTSAERSSSVAPCRLTASLYARLSSAIRRMPGTTPTVLIVILLGPMLMPRVSLMISSALITAS